MSTMYNFNGIISVEYHHRGTGSQSLDDRWLFAHKLIPEMRLFRAHDPVVRITQGKTQRAPSVRRIINAHSSLSLTIINNNKLYKNFLPFITILARKTRNYSP